MYPVAGATWAPLWAESRIAQNLSDLCQLRMLTQKIFDRPKLFELHTHTQKERERERERERQCEREKKIQKLYGTTAK